MSNAIIELLQNKIEGAGTNAKWEDAGEVIEVGDGVVSVAGLTGCKYGEKLKIGNSGAMALNLEENSVGAILFNEIDKVKIGDKVTLTGEIMSIGCGEELIGRAVNPLGVAVDGKPLQIAKPKLMPVERIAPGVITRQGVDTPLQTGIKAIDAMTPIGRGQRELIIGDRGTGKTAIAVDTIINQKGTGVICIYVAIGQKESKIAKLVAKLNEYDAMSHTIIVVAGASDPAAMNFLAPYAGCAIGEYFMEQGKDVLVVYDDLSKHAWSYREISLLLQRPPGREAFPGDVFYLHSRLLERSAKLNKENGGGSITALPIIETQSGDVSAYIPTNVISITDGQIYLEGDLFYQGIRPAVNVGLSVSRVGGAAQTKAMKKIAGRLRLDLAQYRELAAFAQFGSDLDENTRRQLERGKRVVEILKQLQFEPMPFEQQVVSIFAATKGLLDEVEVEKIAQTEKTILTNLRSSHKNILDELREKQELSEQMEASLEKAIRETVGSQTTPDDKEAAAEDSQKTE